MDTYFRGNSQELDFCNKIQAGGNHVVAATADGRELGANRDLKLRERELAAVVEEYLKISDAERRTKLPDPKDATPPRRPKPDPPVNGMIIRGYCTYINRDDDGKFDRAKQWYYKENPDRWAAETQSDMLWLTEEEWKSLVPAQAKPGNRIAVAAEIQRRFYCTIGIDYMEGSVNSLPARDMTMALTVERVTPQAMELRLDGYARLGKELDDKTRTESHTRGCDVRVLGFATIDRKTHKFTRLDIVGIGQAWGNKMNYVGREVRLDNYPWHYGIACELVTGDSPADLIPPYNLLHYNSAGPYFGGSTKVP